jgi:hypothetical protein
MILAFGNKDWAASDQKVRRQGIPRSVLNKKIKIKYKPLQNLASKVISLKIKTERIKERSRGTA